MINLPAVSRDHVLTALETYDAAGVDDMVAQQTGGKSAVVLLHEARTYDGAIIMGLAHGLATGYTPDPAEIQSRTDRVASALKRCGFDVLATAAPAPVTPPRPSRVTKKAALAPGRQTAKAARRPEAVCPTCFMALPATGICDNCGG